MSRKPVSHAVKPLQIFTPTEQVALHLEEEIISERMYGEMPGVKTLSVQLGVNHKTVDGAVKILESKGLIHSNGTGKKRTITSGTQTKRKALKVNILHYDPDDPKLHYMINIRDELQKAGHNAEFSPKSLSELRMDMGRIEKQIDKNPADAWIVQSAGREVLEWFVKQGIPSFGLFGRFRKVKIAATGTSKEDAVIEAVRTLHQLGHRRIVMLVQEEQCMPSPAAIPRVFLNTLEELGIPSGRYNLPYWHKGSESFHRCLDSLFQHTPPTALLIPEPHLFIAAQQHLATKGIVAPKDISMICHDPSSAFRFCSPEISHISYDLTPCIQRVTQWVRHVAAGKVDHRQVLSKAQFVRGGTIGPPP